ncbi:Desmoglein-3 [Manis pentadactyla]|nr:Desmoglein-3 [Manis pentadactyla]
MKKEQKKDILQGPGISKSTNKQATYLEVKKEGEEEGQEEEMKMEEEEQREEKENISKCANVCHDVETRTLQQEDKDDRGDYQIYILESFPPPHSFCSSEHLLLSNAGLHVPKANPTPML